MKYKLEQVLPGQVRLLFALDKEDTFEKNKIGHVRGDFGSSGDQFFSIASYYIRSACKFHSYINCACSRMRLEYNYPLSICSFSVCFAPHSNYNSLFGNS